MFSKFIIFLQTTTDILTNVAKKASCDPQKEGKNLIWFGKIDWKSAKFTVLPLIYFKATNQLKVRLAKTPLTPLYPSFPALVSLSKKGVVGTIVRAEQMLPLDTCTVTIVRGTMCLWKVFWVFTFLNKAGIGLWSKYLGHLEDLAEAPGAPVLV